MLDSLMFDKKFRIINLGKLILEEQYFSLNMLCVYILQNSKGLYLFIFLEAVVALQDIYSAEPLLAQLPKHLLALL